MKNTIFLCILISNLSFGQSFEDEGVDETKITPWKVDDYEKYEGRYAFGFSEGESTVTISIDKNVACAQLRFNEWKEEYIDIDEGAPWYGAYLNYNNVKIEGNLFFSDQSNGEFVLYHKDGKDIPCLKLNKSPYLVYSKIEEHEIFDYELGSFAGRYIEWKNSRFKETEFEIIPLHRLASLSLEELKIMRNEIFARYGYIFKKGGEMDTYFNKQDWYLGIKKKEGVGINNDDPDNYLTAIEKANLKNILKEEEKKRKATYKE